MPHITTKKLFNAQMNKILKRYLHSKREVQDVYIASTARTPLGSMGGQLKGLKATELGSSAIKTCLEKVNVSPKAVEEVLMGCVLQSGLGQAPARQAALGAGLEVSTPCTTINKVCASGMKAMSLSSAELSLGHRNVMVAGGMESLSNTPYTMPRGATPYGGIKLHDTCNYDGLTDAYTGWHMGKCAENTAVQMGITRKAQDDYGIESYRRTEKAIKDGLFAKEIVPVKAGKKMVSEDEEVGRCNYDTFRVTPTYWGETVGVGSSSKLADGAAAALLCNQTGLSELGVSPLARIVDWSDAALEPTQWPIAPATGVKQLLERNCLKVEDIALWEINEAFAVVVIANSQLLGLDLTKVNIHGGAIAIGHPFGMSGARITNHLVLSLEPGQLGIATLCNGGGGAGSILVQRM